MLSPSVTFAMSRVLWYSSTEALGNSRGFLQLYLRTAINYDFFTPKQKNMRKSLCFLKKNCIFAVDSTLSERMLGPEITNNKTFKTPTSFAFQIRTF